TSEVELQRGEKIGLTLPPKQIAVVEAEQIAAMPPLFPRPDLAISAQEVRVEGNWLVVPVHNIGSADAPKTTILLRDRTGRRVIKAEVPALKAPLDLQPKVHIARLPLPPTALKPLQVIVDPENLIAEIYEGNNFVVVQRSSY
ncbi:MAG: CARDB domain-containing protein, partial [Armatimonadota bacterium]|nr:CARDB domain-containing protein [Armatimonadota bacterium]